MNANEDLKLEMSISLRDQNSDLFYSKLDSQEKIQELIEFLRNPLGVDFFKNGLYMDSAYDSLVTSRHPLINGLEFNTKLDTSVSLLAIKNNLMSDSTSLKNLYRLENIFSSSYMNDFTSNVRVGLHDSLAHKRRRFFKSNIQLNLEAEVTAKSILLNVNFPIAETMPLLSFGEKDFILNSDSTEYIQSRQFERQEDICLLRDIICLRSNQSSSYMKVINPVNSISINIYMSLIRTKI